MRPAGRYPLGVIKRIESGFPNGQGILINSGRHGPASLNQPLAVHGKPAGWIFRGIAEGGPSLRADASADSVIKPPVVGIPLGFRVAVGGVWRADCDAVGQAAWENDLASPGSRVRTGIPRMGTGFECPMGMPMAGKEGWIMKPRSRPLSRGLPVGSAPHGERLGSRSTLDTCFAEVSRFIAVIAPGPPGSGRPRSCEVRVPKRRTGASGRRSTGHLPPW